MMKKNIPKRILLTAALFGLFGAMAVQAQIKNPILPGFYPDPSICRAGPDYYIVNSSFTCFPGVPIFHSTDLMHWKQIGHVLDRPSQLKLGKQNIRHGIWAPSIRYNTGTFYMITTLQPGGNNFYVTAKDPAGPWSEPTWLPELKGGIDPSFFFDEDGQAYVIYNAPPPEGSQYPGHRALWIRTFNVQDHHCGKATMLINGGVDITQKPIWVEGPHIFNHKGYYYLSAAEGGTSIDHSQVIFRSKSLTGPFIPFENNPIMTQRSLPADRPDPVTSTGHADYVQLPDGQWISVFLGVKPYGDNQFNTGRQTFFNLVDWSGEWPIIIEKGTAVPAEVKAPLTPESGRMTFAEASADWRDDFDEPTRKFDWISIRTPKEEWAEIKNGKLQLKARPVSISTIGNPTFLGRRQQHKNCEFSTSVTLEAGKNMEAGIVAFQNENFFYKLVLLQDEQRAYLKLSSGKEEIQQIELKNYTTGQPILLRMQSRTSRFKCEYSLDQKTWIAIGPTLDGTHLSTKVAKGFTGSIFGLYAFAESPATATFEWAAYQELVPEKGALK